MSISNLYESNTWRIALKSNDVNAIMPLLESEISSAIARGNRGEENEALFAALGWYSSGNFKNQEMAYSALNRLLENEEVYTGSLSIQVAMIMWERWGDIPNTLKLIDIYDPDSLSYEPSRDWWTFIAQSIRLGIAFSMQSTELEMIEILSSVKKRIYIGNLCQEYLMKSIDLIIEGRRDAGILRVSDRVIDEVEDILWWIWADAKRLERYLPDLYYDTIPSIELLIDKLP